VVNNRTDLHEIFFTAVRQAAMAMKQVAEGSNNARCMVMIEVKAEIKSEN
jgi:hypothetical protein